jgi:hypothetical protein
VRAWSAASRLNVCVQPEMQPAARSALASVRPVEPLSFGGYGPSPSKVSSAEYSRYAPAWSHEPNPRTNAAPAAPVPE